MNTLYDDLRASLHGIWQRRWLALAVAWVVCVLGWLAVTMVPNSYESKARIFVQMYDPLSSSVGIGDADRKASIEKVRDTLTSSQNLEKVIRSTRLSDGVTSRKQMDGAIGGLAKAIKITADQDNIFTITATARSMRLSDAENARLSRDVVQKLIDIFREGNIVGNQTEMKQTLTFMDQQLSVRQNELQAAEQRRLAFEAQHPELAQGGISILQRMEQGRQAIRGLDSDIIAAQSALAAINAQISSTPQTIAATGPAGGLRGQLSQIQADLAMMRARGLTENHPDVIAARNQIVALRAQIRQEGSSGVPSGTPNPAYASLESIRAERGAALQALQARRVAAETELNQTTAAQLSNPQLMQEAQNIIRDYDVLKQQYDKMLKDREDLRLRGQVVSVQGSAKVDVLDPPVLPRGPVAPNRPLLLFMVLAGGIVAGLGVAFVAGELRSSFGTTSKLEKATGLPVLGAISQSLSPAGRAEQARKTRNFYAASALLGGLFALLMAMEFIQRGMIA
ncbi:chain-length determining protein [Novosphingobium sp. FSY-8]|uniref:Chain-length determining protein n=1 Tax=Novosphingobium ovatum TaxID=1908523 RepID=A0ABW9XC13_9SPHN|nr:XrtA system polysaccharide chain length determinant [Novosphingobium ovatum]NBC36070.1 chain-length determining protein [Novosphingobium ovatum]